MVQCPRASTPGAVTSHKPEGVRGEVGLKPGIALKQRGVDTVTATCLLMPSASCLGLLLVKSNWRPEGKEVLWCSSCHIRLSSPEHQYQQVEPLQHLAVKISRDSFPQCKTKG